MKQRRLRAVGYTRVSTAEQIHGFCLDVQTAAIRQWARSSNARLIGLISDEGVSGSNGLESREGLAEARALLEGDVADVLVVYRLDRLARDLILQETTIERLRLRGRDVVSVTEPDVSGSDPTRVLIRQVLGALAQYERALIKARMTAGREAKRQAGGYAGGRPPYGYKAEGRELVANDAEQKVIAEAQRLRDQGRSLREIADELAGRGLEPRSGSRWHPTQVARLVSGS